MNITLLNEIHNSLKYKCLKSTRVIECAFCFGDWPAYNVVHRKNLLDARSMEVVAVATLGEDYVQQWTLS